MFLFSLLAFAAVLVVLGVAAARGLARIDDVLEIEFTDADVTPPAR